MDIILCKNEEYKKLWEQTLPANRRMCELPALSFLDTSTGTLYVSDEDVEMIDDYKPKKVKYWWNYIWPIFSKLMEIVVVLFAGVYIVLAPPIHSLNDTFKILVICLLIIIMGRTIYLGE